MKFYKVAIFTYSSLFNSAFWTLLLLQEDRVNDAEDSGEGNMDLSEELHPIGYYINDREEMINQMFSIIKGDKLRAMLPPIMKVILVIWAWMEDNCAQNIRQNRILWLKFHA